MKLKKICDSLGFSEFDKQLIDNILRLCDENPDFVYVDRSNLPDDNTQGPWKVYCKYFGPATIRKESKSDGKMIEEIVGPNCRGCLIGQALQCMGWTREDIDPETEISASDLLRSYCDPIIRRIVSKAQSLQDYGTNWGQIAKTVRDHLAEFKIGDGR